ncbi:MAG: signal peptidase II [Bdellovibrionota bacterium]
MKKRYLTLLPTFVGLLALDLWTKSLISEHFRLGQSKPVIDGFLQLTLVHNYGAAFGIGQKWSTLAFMGISVVATSVVVYLFLQLKAWEKLSAWGLTFILAGALGNIVDRIRLGYVVDFVDVYYKTYHWYVFNIADSCITIGAILFGIDVFFIQPKIQHNFPWDATKKMIVDPTEKLPTSVDPNEVSDENLQDASHDHESSEPTALKDQNI